MTAPRRRSRRRRAEPEAAAGRAARRVAAADAAARASEAPRAPRAAAAGACRRRHLHPEPPQLALPHRARVAQPPRRHPGGGAGESDAMPLRSEEGELGKVAGDEEAKGAAGGGEEGGAARGASHAGVVVVSGETGCGKTTQVRSLCSTTRSPTAAAVMSIICTQPRRIWRLASRTRRRRARRTHGHTRYGIRLESKRSRPRVLFCTTGVLLRRLHADGGLKGVSHVIVDEVHERSLDGDFLLIVLRDLLVMRPELRLVLMSATLNADLFASYFGLSPPAPPRALSAAVASSAPPPEAEPLPPPARRGCRRRRGRDGARPFWRRRSRRRSFSRIPTATTMARW